MRRDERAEERHERRYEKGDQMREEGDERYCLFKIRDASLIVFATIVDASLI